MNGFRTRIATLFACSIRARFNSKNENDTTRDILGDEAKSCSNIMTNYQTGGTPWFIFID